jgi:uncharacterized protein
MTQPSTPQPGGGPVVPTGAAAVTHRPLAGAAARITAGLLHDWQRRNATASLPLALRQLEVAGNLANLRLVIAGAHEGYQGPVFMDSDLYKTLEAIGWELARTGDGTAASPDDLVSFVTEATLLLAKAQQPDGYLNSYIQVTGQPRYAALASSHELYCAGAYNETCAAIAAFQWSWRLLLATGESRYADLMERVLYNGFAGAIATSGTRFCYVNPLQRRADHFEKDDPGRRREWFSCACCPPNIMRLTASLQHYLATVSGDTLYLHQFTGAQLAAPLAGGELAVRMITSYPWSGRIEIQVTSAPPGPAGLALRGPAWAATPQLWLNGQPQPAGSAGAEYRLVHRRWQPGDVLRYELDLTPRLTGPGRRVDAVRGMAAIERGPLVYCFEQADQSEHTDLEDLAITPGGLRERAADLPGIGPTIVIDTNAVRLPAAAAAGLPYQAAPGDLADQAAGDPVAATAIPYFHWDNRDGRAMRVWMPSRPAGPHQD